MERASNPKEVKQRWDSYELPAYMEGDTFLDVGCWGGGFVREAVNRGATFAMGVDSVIHDSWKNTEKQEFVKMDIYSPHFLTLPRFNVVLCAGVFYHVPDPVGLLTRLRAVMSDEGELFLETAIKHASVPSLMFCSGDSFDNNPSNWFVPSLGLVYKLQQELGFVEFEAPVFPSPSRVVYHLGLRSYVPTKYLPRKKEYMR